MEEVIKGYEIKKELKVCAECKVKLSVNYHENDILKIVPPSLLRKIERSNRKRLEREEELAEEEYGD